MSVFASRADRDAIEAEHPWPAQDAPRTVYERLSRTADAHGWRDAITFQLLSGPQDKAETLTWSELHGRVTQTANLFRSLGVGEGDVVACLMPNCNETAQAILGGMTAGIVNPINPLLDPEHIAGILRHTNAKVLVTLKSFPKSDVAQKAAEALRHAPNVETVLEVDLTRYLTPPKSWIVPLIRPKTKVRHRARVLDFTAERDRQKADALDFEDRPDDRVAAYFHTGGTTGLPKVAQHRNGGLIYNGWIGERLLFGEEDTIMCPLPLFHVFACQVILLAMITSGAHGVFPTPAGYRGDGVFDNFWKLIERWRVTFIIAVPTAISALMQRPVDADVSSVKIAFSGSSPLPVELFRRFEKATGVNIVEGYGLTEATCLVSCNPVDGEKRIGSVGIPFPHTKVTIRKPGPDGVRECGVDEVGEICVASPGVYPGVYTEEEKNGDMYHRQVYLRTGDLGRVDADGYLWITGRAKDLIIRGGHNIDPAEIEEALSAHDAVAVVGAIGQPDAHAGELPCAYVELCAGSTATPDELMAFARDRIHERAAYPKYIEVLDELPKTAVGKVFKPDLRRRAIARVYNEALEHAGVAAEVSEVVEDPKRGLVARLRPTADDLDHEALRRVLGDFTRPWELETDA
ncbi:acyl-CoA synthetase [Mesobaculum littorinae]|uniref:Acyl-CoA synthetase n=1 Tax=Mesobaculum littorinae TaxID=2486419 RepID=A0A438AM21_9RHOB|nr:acyl-CoA synthetase [Mesobaculum littorinae]RVV99586.1 acyl-CoA synthetase [Mesobaculum littorinae]